MGLSAIFPGAVATALELLTAQNNSMIVLDVDCDIDDDVLTVDDASALPASGYLTFVDTEEVIYYTGKTSNTLTGVTRGADDTAPLPHLAGVDLEQRWNADYHNLMAAELIAVETNISNRIGLHATQLLAMAGSVGAPSYSRVGGTDTGIYFTGVAAIDFAITGLRAGGFNSSLQLTLPKTSSQLVLGTTNTTTISATAPAASRVYTIPDAGGAANFLLSGWAQIVNADISASAAIAYSKLSLTGSIVNADINASAAIVYSKLSLTGSIVNADINASAAIAQSKLSLSITNSEVNASAAIARSKLAALTVSRAMVTDGSGFDAVATTTATEIGYVNGVTSSIQTQLDARVLDTGDTMTGDLTLANQKAIIFKEATGGGTDSVTVKAAAAISTSYTLLLPAAGPSANLQVVRVKDYTTGELEFGTGGGSGGINYLSVNPDAEAGTTGWAVYADAAATTPVDGTGGSPSVTITRNTSSPLRGTGMFTITKGATNRQGDGASYDFTIDAADKATMLQISFDYQVSANFAAGDASDVKMFIYDVTNAILIPVTPYTIQGGTGGPRKFSAVFQTAYNSVSYRLIFHVSTTNASAWTMDFDNVIVGPQKSVWGAPVTDWVSYTPATPGGITLGNGSIVGQYRRVGDSMEIRLHLAWGSSTSLSGNMTIHGCVPSGYSIDSAKITAVDYRNLGYVLSVDSSASASYPGMVRADSASAIYIAAQGVNVVSSTVPFTWATSDACSIVFTVPITGWGSNVQMSNDTDTRVVAMRAGAAANSFTGSTTVINPTVVYDTHGAYNSSTGIYTVPVAGKYRITAAGRFTSGAWATGNQVSIFIQKNGANTSLHEIIIQNGYTEKFSTNHSTEIDCVPGDTLNYGMSMNRTAGALALEASPTSCYLTISRISGPATIAATEYIAASYNTTAGNTVTNYAGSAILVDFATKEFDTHGCVTTGASWKFTCPIAGKYRVTGGCSTSAPTWNAGSILSLVVCKNGTQAKQIGFNVAQAAFTGRLKTAGGSAIIQCAAGDYLDLRIVQNSGSSITLEADTTLNYIQVERVGN